MIKNTFLVFSFVSSWALASSVASGKLVISKELAAKAKGIRTVFISIYDSTSPAPMPCAAQKFELKKDAEGEFYQFTVDEKSITLMACDAVPEKMNLKAKLDKDGSAGRDAAGDIVGMLNDVKKGSSGLRISLDKSF